MKFCSCGRCVSWVNAMCILYLVSCCVISCCVSLEVNWSGFMLTIDRVLFPCCVFMVVSLSFPSANFCFLCIFSIVPFRFSFQLLFVLSLFMIFWGAICLMFASPLAAYVVRLVVFFVDLRCCFPRGLRWLAW